MSEIVINYKCLIAEALIQVLVLEPARKVD